MYPKEFIGESSVVQSIRKLISRVARSKANVVLIYGETGTGKGLVAEKLHEQSTRSKKPFIDVNCASIPGDLFDQELFGQEGGRIQRCPAAQKWSDQSRQWRNVVSG